MPDSLPFSASNAKALPLHLVSETKYGSWLKTQPSPVKRWLKDTGFTAKKGHHSLLPNGEGALCGVVIITTEKPDVWSIAAYARTLPRGTYKLDKSFGKETDTALALGWALGSYRYDEYKTTKATVASTLVLPKTVDRQLVDALATSVFLCRTLINRPANDKLPTQFSAMAEEVAKEFKASTTIIRGKNLLKENYPSIYTVGKGSADDPCLVDIRWGKKSAPKVTLVGKGICFDSGGINLKPGNSSKLMKKDMGGAAIALCLGRAIMMSKLNVNLRVLLPMAENAISGSAMRPMDVIRTRKGITVEVGNTDAEGRLVVSDALAEADSEKPDLLIDCTTLTGAARVALGTDLPAYFTHNDKLAAQLEKASKKTHDPVYRMPLESEYRSLINGQSADITNDAEGNYGGAITAALFLNEFVEHTQNWIHFDMMAWNLKDKPGRPAGAEAHALRALYALIEERYGH